MELESDKLEAVRQWSQDPCGAVGAGDVEWGSKEFFEAVDRDRYEKYMPWLRAAVGFNAWKGRRVLEIGFGLGTDLLQFALGGAEVAGVDLSPRHLELAKTRFDLYAQKAQLRLADGESLPFESGSFDLVYSFGVIHHTPNTRKALDEIFRVLKPGGRAIIGVYHRNSAYFYLSILLPYILTGRFLKESFRRTMARVEFREHSEACPLVKVISKRELGRMLNKFFDAKITVHHLEPSHFWFLRHFIPGIFMKSLEAKFGWYLLGHAQKE